MYAQMLGPGHVAELDPPSHDGVKILYSDEYVAKRMEQRSLYEYCQNNPLNCVDPSGLSPPEKTFVMAHIRPGIGTIMCMEGELVVWNDDDTIIRECVQLHEEQHMKDWFIRWGTDVCCGAKDYRTPIGGEGYEDFLRISECRAIATTLFCVSKLRPATDEDKKKIRNTVFSIEAHLISQKCTTHDIRYSIHAIVDILKRMGAGLDLEAVVGKVDR